MRYLFLLSILFFYCRCNSDNKIKKEQTLESLNKEKNTRDSLVIRDDALPKVEEYPKIFTTLKVDVISVDSIMVEVTFINDSTKGIWLYKPILPNDTLAEYTFVIRTLDDDNLPHIYRKSDQRYYGGNYLRFISNVIPEVVPENLILLNPGESQSFKMNISNHYNFDSCMKIKKNSFSIGYVVKMPLIEELKHVSEMDTIREMRRPVYFLINSRNPNTRKRERIDFAFPYKPGK